MTAVVLDVMKTTSRGLIAVAGQQSINVFTHEITTLVDGTDSVVLAELSAEVLAIFNTIKTSVSDQFQIVDFRVENQTQDTILGETPSTYVGSGTADPLPAQVAALVLGRTATKRVQGRKYLGGFDETDNTSGGLWVGLAVTELAAFAAAYIAPFTGLSGNIYQPGVSTRPTFPLPIIFTAFNGSRVVPNARTQRSRTKRFAFS